MKTSTGLKLPRSISLALAAIGTVSLWGCTEENNEHSSKVTSSSSSLAPASVFTEIEGIASENINDWMTELILLSYSNNEPTSAIKPAANSEQIQSPPSFAWPLDPAATAMTEYDIEIQFDAAQPHSTPFNNIQTSTKNNWFMPYQAFPAGNYRWRVTQKNGAQVKVSEWRKFAVSENVLSIFEEPKQPGSEEEWYEIVANRAHPRAMPEWLLIQTNQMIRDDPKRKALWEEVKKNAQSHKADITPPLDKELIRIERQITVYNLSKQQNNHDLANEMIGYLTVRAKSIIEQDPISLKTNLDDLRDYLWIAVLLYDSIQTELEQKVKVDLRKRINESYALLEGAVLAPSRPLERNPHEGLLVVSFYVLAASAAIMAEPDGSGNPNEFNKDRFAKVVPMLYAFFPSFLRDDGGWGNGGGYAINHVINTYPRLDALRYATGANPYHLQPLYRSALYHLYTRPPGAPTVGPFGDMSENFHPKGEYGYLAFWWGTRIPSFESRWTANKTLWPNAHSKNATTLLSPSLTETTTDPQRNSAIFPSVGQAAIHSSLASDQRTSIHFRSGPYGSFNHNHADQNSFTIIANGTPVLIDSGYYDKYQGTHWKNWYAQTIAHNAITYTANGKTYGQRMSNYGATGSIFGYQDHESFTAVDADATMAYSVEDKDDDLASLQVQRARRSMVYLKNYNALLVWDYMKANKNVRWEWNLHSQSTPKKINGTYPVKIKISHNQNDSLNKNQACIQQLGGNTHDFYERSYPGTHTYSSFPTEPENYIAYTQQYHMYWAQTTDKPEMQTVFLIDINCSDLLKTGSLGNIRVEPSATSPNGMIVTIDATGGFKKQQYYFSRGATSRTQYLIQ
ncbi:MAG TPA: heparinase II/III family protein [Chitinolyticbacter sp.]|nr:heparinase II/III family protein [Chitinolyticbacter sp.]